MTADDATRPRTRIRRPHRGFRVLGLGAAIVLVAGITTAGVTTLADRATVPALADVGGSGWFPDAQGVARFDGPRWQHHVPWTADLVGQSVLMSAADGDLLVQHGGQLHLVDGSTGAIVWRTSAYVSELLWWYATPTAGGDLVVTSREDQVVALDRATGAPRWTARLPGVIESVHTDDRTVVATSTTGGPLTTAAFDAATGERLWSRRHVKVDDVSEGQAILSHIVPTTEVATEVVDPRSGETRWSIEVSEQARVEGMTSGVLVTGSWPDTSVPSPPRTVSGRRVADGALLWSRTLEGGGSETVGDGVVYAVDGVSVLALDAVSGESLWTGEGQSLWDPEMTAGDAVVISVGLPPGSEDPSDPMRTIEARSADDGAVLWSRSQHLAGVGSLVIGGHVIVHRAGELVGFDEITGEEAWGLPLRPPAACELMVAGDGLVLTSGRELVSIATASGEERWRAAPLDDDAAAPPAGEVVLPAASSTGVVAATGSLAGWTYRDRGTFELHGYSVAGERRWRSARSAPAHFPPVVSADGALLVVEARSGAAQLTTLEREGAGERWSAVSGPLTVRPVEAGPSVVTVDGTGRVVARDLLDGEERWEHRMDRPTTPVPDGTPANMPIQASVLATEEVVVTVGESRLEVLDAVTGELRREGPLQGGTRGAAAVTDEVVLVGVGSELVALDLASGSRAWSAEVDGGVGAGVSVAGGLVFVATGAGLAILDLTWGEVLDEVATERVVLAPPLPVGDGLYTCDASGTVTAW